MKHHARDSLVPRLVWEINWDGRGWWRSWRQHSNVQIPQKRWGGGGSLGEGGAFCGGGNAPLPNLALQGKKPCMNRRCLEFSNSKGRDNFEIMRVCICNWEALDWKLVSSSENNRKCMNRCKENLVFGTETFRENFLNAVYFRRGLTCTLTEG